MARKRGEQDRRLFYAGRYVDCMSGRVWHVNPANGSDNNSGKSSDDALATYDAAVKSSSGGLEHESVSYGPGTPHAMIFLDDDEYFENIGKEIVRAMSLTGNRHGS